MGRAMGARRSVMRAVLVAAALAVAARAAASTVVEPIARLSLDGGYDSNPLYDGLGGDRVARISPEVGLKAMDHLWNLQLQYGGEWVRYEERAQKGFWNQHGVVRLRLRPVERMVVTAQGRLAYADDPIGLALLGVFRTGRETALFGQGRARATYRLTERLDGGVTFDERIVMFGPGDGSAVHAGAVEALWHATPRLDFGADYRLSAFQTFLPAGGSEFAFGHALHARAAYELSRRWRVEAGAGPALWTSPRQTDVVADAWLALSRTDRFDDLHVTLQHGIGMGSTAAPALVSSIEAGGEHRIGRRFALRGMGGLWYSGEAPSNANPTLGWAVAAEALLRFSRGMHIGVAASHLARLDDPSPALRRTTVTLGLGWELEAR
jgi:hypothetical protein